MGSNKIGTMRVIELFVVEGDQGNGIFLIWIVFWSSQSELKNNGKFRKKLQKTINKKKTKKNELFSQKSIILKKSRFKIKKKNL